MIRRPAGPSVRVERAARAARGSGRRLGRGLSAGRCCRLIVRRRFVTIPAGAASPAFAERGDTGREMMTTRIEEIRGGSGRRIENARRFFRRVHRLIGLSAGVVLVLMGLSGAILTYREAIDEQLNAALMRVVMPPGQAALLPVETIVSAALAAMPPGGRPERLLMPRHAEAAAKLSYMVETDDLDTSVREIFVDPYTARVTGERLFLHGDDPFSQPLVQILMTFHWTLFLGVNNAWIVGTLGIALFVSVGLGLYLWWPANGNWRAGLKIKRGASRERMVFDLHKSVGVYCGAFLLVTLFTGVAMIFKPATRAVTTMFSTVRADPDFGKSSPAPGRAPIGAGAAVASAERVFPEGRLHWILFPATPTGVYVIGKQSDSEPNQTVTTRNVGVEQYTGEVLAIQDRARFTGGERFLEWLFPLHSGEVFAGRARPIVLVLGLAPLVLFMTGLLRWLQSRQTRRRMAR